MRLTGLVYLLPAILAGCASLKIYNVENAMQPDATHRVFVKGGGFTNLEECRREASRRADLLCGNGWQTVEDLVVEPGYAPQYQLVVRCKS